MRRHEPFERGGRKRQAQQTDNHNDNVLSIKVVHFIGMSEIKTLNVTAFVTMGDRQTNTRSRQAGRHT